MLNLKDKLATLKERFVVQESKDKDLKAELKKTIGEALHNPLLAEKCIKDVYIKNKLLIIVTAHKTFANELFFIKQDIMRRLKPVRNDLTDVVIY